MKVANQPTLSESHQQIQKENDDILKRLEQENNELKESLQRLQLENNALKNVRQKFQFLFFELSIG
jgi:hypothetical protein